MMGRPQGRNVFTFITIFSDWKNFSPRPIETSSQYSVWIIRIKVVKTNLTWSADNNENVETSSVSLQSKLCKNKQNRDWGSFQLYFVIGTQLVQSSHQSVSQWIISIVALRGYICWELELASGQCNVWKMTILIYSDFNCFNRSLWGWQPIDWWDCF